MGYSSWGRYVPVAERRANAAKLLKASQKKGVAFNPVVVEGRSISKTFWGKAWCDNLEAYSDYENRLPRGRTYVRNGSILDLQISSGQVSAKVMGSQLYRVTVTIAPMAADLWHRLVAACTGKIDSLIELLQGRFSHSVMEILTKQENGLFPKPKEISMKCSCPDWAEMCKHVAATLYGVGSILDRQPESLFVLRHVDHLDLISQAHVTPALVGAQEVGGTFSEGELSALFGSEGLFA